MIAYGWESHNWLDFYPDDLPEEWRLDYFYNQFSGVVVPAEMVTTMTCEIAEQWLDAVDDDFRFILEVKKGERPDSDLLKVFGKTFGGLIEINHGRAFCDGKEAIIYNGDNNPREIRDFIESVSEEEEEKLVVITSGEEPWKVVQSFDVILQMLG